MTTAAQLIAYLQTLPPDTQIEILKENSRGYESYVTHIPLVINEGSNFIDFRNNPHVKPESPYFNKTVLELGEQ
jgi:hypothetical protein